MYKTVQFKGGFVRVCYSK